MNYFVCMDSGNYDIKLGKDKDMAICDLEQMLDNMINLCLMYNIDEEEILSELTNDTCFVEINKKVV